MKWWQPALWRVRASGRGAGHHVERVGLTVRPSALIFLPMLDLLRHVMVPSPRLLLQTMWPRCRRGTRRSWASGASICRGGRRRAWRWRGQRTRVPTSRCACVCVGGGGGGGGGYAGALGMEGWYAGMLKALVTPRK